MTLDRKLISIIILGQIISGVLVFGLTRAYYLNQCTARYVPAAPGKDEPDNLSTEALIEGLKKHTSRGVPDNPVQLTEEANLAFQQADYPRAATLYQRVIELTPQDASAHNNLGLTLHYLGHSTRALEILQRGSRLQPDFQRIWLTLGFVQSGLGHTESARQALQRAVELGSDTQPGISAREMLEQLPD
jgi:predicted Zn-dependent protease